MSDERGVSTALPRNDGASGAGKMVLAFLFGVFCAAGSVYFLWNLSGRVTGSGGAGHGQTATAAADTGRPAGEVAQASAEPAKLFASRLSYELSRAPEEPAVSQVKRAATQVVSTPPSAPSESEEQAARARVANARPINTVPPPPRDRTPAIEREAQSATEREARRAEPVGAASPRVIDGREVKLPPTPPRPIVASGPTGSRSETDGERTGRSSDAAGPASANEASASSSSIEARLAATREWLANAPHTTHTIQLMGASNEEQLKLHLRALSKVLDPTKIYVYRTLAQGKPSLTVAYGAYPDRQAALQALEKLPGTVAENRPVLRTVNGIRAEMKQHKTDS